MRLRISKSKNATLYYVIKTIYVKGKQKTKTIERLGNEQEVIEKSNGEDPIIWAKKYIEELNKKEKENTNDVIIKKSQTKQIEKDSQNLYNCGYL
ncbi:MAG: transposase, partial [Clostridia bacterium]